MMWQTTRRFRAALVALALAVLATTSSAQTIPTRLADSTYWRMITEMSEPDGFFRSDNLASNESSLQWVIPTLQKELGTGGVYLGVAPDQNFTYMIALKPSVVFIVDIRRGAMLQHLLYKALFELSSDRAAFLSLLFSRPRPAGLDSSSTIDAMLAAYAPVVADSATYRRNFADITRHLVETHRFVLGPKDIEGMEYVYNAFFGAGPELTYNFGQGNATGGFGGRGRFGMPSYGALLLETDGTGANRSYLANEAGYRWLRDFQSRNLLVPVIGDFAGPKALRGVGDWVRARGATIDAMYVSNVEQYLFMDPDAWRRYYTNVATLPLGANALFVRSVSGRGFMQMPVQSPNGRSVQLVSSVAELLKAFAEGKVMSYQDVIAMGRQ